MARIAFALTVVLLGCAGYGRHLQIARGASLREAGRTQMTRCVRLPAPRGLITDRHGAVLAGNADQNDVAAIPTLLRRNPAAVDTLAGIVGRPAADITNVLAHADGMLVKVGEVDAAGGQKLTAANVPGVVLLPSPRRVYPTGSLAGPFIGFVGADTDKDHKRWPGLPIGERVGRSGIERSYDAVLRGVAGEQCFLVDPRGRPVALDRHRDPVPGLDLRLSIDLGLQQQLSQALAAGLSTSGGDLGGAVIMDAKTGQVLAMASLPALDNNVYGPPLDEAALDQARHAPGHPTLEHVTQVAAPPGSTFKPVVAASNLVNPVLPPDVVIPTGASFSYAGHSFANWRPLGPMNLVGAIAMSNDVYFYKLALMLGPDRIHDIGTALGAGQPTGIDIDEVSGELGTPESLRKRGAPWYPAATVVLGIGQGHVTATPLQAARWMDAIATGQLVTPRLGLDFAGAGQQATPVPARPPAPVPFAGALGPLRDGLRQAVTDGTAALLNGLPISAMAKTGTAEDPSSPNHDTDSWLIAAAPAEDPAIAIAAMVRGGGHGGTTAGPVVRDALQYFADHRADILAVGPVAPPAPPPAAPAAPAPGPRPPDVR
jgi:cell division protein FtsI/penicillin-binding protein 2